MKESEPPQPLSLIEEPGSPSPRSHPPVRPQESQLRRSSEQDSAQLPTRSQRENPWPRRKPGIPGMTVGKGMAGVSPQGAGGRSGTGWLGGKGRKPREAKNTLDASGLGEGNGEQSFQKNKRGRETRGCESRRECAGEVGTVYALHV